MQILERNIFLKGNKQPNIIAQAGADSLGCTIQSCSPRLLAAPHSQESTKSPAGVTLEEAGQLGHLDVVGKGTPHVCVSQYVRGNGCHVFGRTLTKKHLSPTRAVPRQWYQPPIGNGNHS
jgi:hypothetical protein